jgi:hypothetical protein
MLEIKNSIFGKTTVPLQTKIPWLVENFSIGLSHTRFDQYSLTNSIRADFSTHSNDITANISLLDAWEFKWLTRPAGIFTGTLFFLNTTPSAYQRPPTSWGYEDGPWKGPRPPLLGDADLIHKPPASIRFAPIKHARAVTVEPFKFSPAEPVAYELSHTPRIVLGKSVIIDLHH